MITVGFNNLDGSSGLIGLLHEDLLGLHSIACRASRSAAVQASPVAICQFDYTQLGLASPVYSLVRYVPFLDMPANAHYI